jgi:enoyl-CoA hydratase/carnithine racemase
VGEFVRLETTDGIGTIRLDRPPMNALSTQVQAELRAAALEASEDPAVRAVIVWGGERVFAAGSGLAWESQLFAGLFATADMREGTAAFIDKLEPRFTGE